MCCLFLLHSLWQALLPLIANICEKQVKINCPVKSFKSFFCIKTFSHSQAVYPEPIKYFVHRRVQRL